MPVHHHMSGRVSVSDRIARRQDLPALAQIDTVVRERLVLSATVSGNSSHEEINCAGANGRGKGLYLAYLMWVLPESFLSEGSKEIESSIFIEIVLINKLRGSLFNQVGSTNSVRALSQTLLRRLGTSLRKSQALRQEIQFSRSLMSTLQFSLLCLGQKSSKTSRE